MSWTSDCNHDQYLNDFKSLLGKEIVIDKTPVVKDEETPADGGENNVEKVEEDVAKVDSTIPSSLDQFSLDYRKRCVYYNVTACPFIRVSHVKGKRVLNVFHCAIDISSWQIMLLSMAVADPPVSEVVLHGSQLSAQHLVNLKETLEYKKSVTIIKFAYVKFIGGSSVIDALSAILNTGAAYMNFKYCELPSDLLIKYSDLTEKSPCAFNLSLNILDLSGNLIDDAGVSQLLKGLYMNVGLKYLSLKKNKIIGNECLKELAHLLTGRVCTAADSATIKLVSKEVAEHNKINKETNKIRKSNNQPEIPDLPLPDNRICKIGTEMHIVNRHITEIDLSYNPIQYENVLEMCKIMEESEPLMSHDKINGHCNTKVILTNLKEIQFVTYDSERADDIAILDMNVDEAASGLNEQERKEIKAIDIGNNIILEI